jgi:hypothetical protein
LLLKLAPSEKAHDFPVELPGNAQLFWDLIQFDHRADLRIANQLASVINARKPISKYA